ncbi:hypothetical protein, variant [Aphanomyces invadans]|uniref:FYVE-type domain-containing protein n=1 Tax=Aphanomyces invadans TaxID=157072 RepID=A0A024U0X4_9STRA|nr:hypothetical protein, variant [Aphanomyces invadans]ETV99546.1 hypothetical protein, variant [Aphanomyces invadans]|eukprot:XP_008872102.1 hypothetical protein, variant [Aphanomyces invadans]
MAEPSIAPIASTAAPRPTTPVALRPLTPTSPAMAPSDASPTQRVLGVFFPDDDVNVDRVHECPVCLRTFSLVRFKHRCKACDRNVCNDCSKSRLRLDDMGLDGANTPKRGGGHHVARKDRGHKSSRVCDPCARSYFESKLEADFSTSSTPLVTPLLHPALTPPSLDLASDACLPLSPSAKHHVGASALPPHNVAVRPTTIQWLRRRHFVFFGVFSFFLVIRLLAPQRFAQRSTVVNVPRAFVGTDAVVAAIHRMTRLDVFAVGLLVLVAVDEWLAFRRTRMLKSPQTVNRTQHLPPDAKSVSDCPDGVAMTPDATPGTAAPIRVDVEASGGLSCTNDDVSLDKLCQVLTDSCNEGSDMTVASYSTCSAETAKLLVCFGKATAFAGSTVAGYVESIESAMAASTLQAKPLTLRDVVAKEVELGTASSGGKKNPSVSRCVLRLLWFLEFVETILGVLTDSSTEDDIGTGVSKGSSSLGVFICVHFTILYDVNEGKRRCVPDAPVEGNNNVVP